jgi:putative endonuclease
MNKAQVGKCGEQAAARYLRRKGYDIIERNLHISHEEIDIVAINKQYIAFVEVKTRTVGHENGNEPRPASAVTPEKQRKIISASQHYIARHKTEKRISMDVIEVYLNEDKTKNKIIHIENAFNLNTAYERKANKR